MTTEPSATWAEIVIPVGAAHVDDVAALVASEIPAAAAGTEQRGDEVVFWVRQEAAADALTATRNAVARWQAGGLTVDPVRVRTAAAMPEAEWRDAWKKYFRVSRLTRQFVVVPSWEQFSPGPDDIVIDLDPGMAFGTGTHASTRLVLEEIQTLADDGAAPGRILDVGCGSGILAIAAIKRWPGATCIAIDTDPNAIVATRDNTAVNGVGERIAASIGTLTTPEPPSGTLETPDVPQAGATPKLPGEGARATVSAASSATVSETHAATASATPAGATVALPVAAPGITHERFPLVLANIQAHVLRGLRAALIASTAPGGTLILSGLLTPQAQPLADEFVAAGMRCVRVRASTDDPQWSCAVLVR
jgi:ribosomal protein L11 methyltransferase